MQSPAGIPNLKITQQTEDTAQTIGLVTLLCHFPVQICHIVWSDESQGERVPERAPVNWPRSWGHSDSALPHAHRERVSKVVAVAMIFKALKVSVKAI